MRPTRADASLVRWVRVSFALSVPFNLLAAGLLAFPGTTPGQRVGLPADVPAVYAALGAYLVALFAVAYAWVARQPVLPTPVVAFCGVAKCGVFALALGLWSVERAAGALVGLAAGDLLFGALWIIYAKTELRAREGGATSSARSRPGT